MPPPLTVPVPPGTVDDVHYPEGDGKPIAETPIHVQTIMWLFEALQDHFAGRHDIYLCANSFMYYVRGDPKKRLAPDVLIAKGVTGSHIRRSYRVWEDGPPCAIIEIASKNKWKKDLTTKREVYSHIGVKDYFVFDPDRRYLKPSLQGFRLEQLASAAMIPEADGTLTGNELGLRLRPEGTMLRLIDLASGQPIPTRSERIQQEIKRADALAAEVARLRKQLPPQTEP